MKAMHVLNYFKRIVAFLLLLWYAGGYSNGQQIIKQFTVEDGLPSSEVYDIHQDFDGYIWFCTDRGVSRYNGYEFENFTSSNGLTCNTLFKVFEDKDHNLWFTGFNGTMSIFNYTNQQFEPFEYNEKLQANLGPYNWVTAINFKGEDVFLFPFKHVKDLTVNEKHQDCHFRYSTSHHTFRDSQKLLDPFIGDMINERQYITFPVIFNGSISDYTTLKSKGKTLSQSEINEVNKSFSQNRIMTIDYFGDLKIINSGTSFDIIKKGRKPITFDIEASNFEQDNEGNLWVSSVSKGVFLIKNTGVDVFEFPDLLQSDEKITVIDVYKNFPIIATSMSSIIQPDNHKVLYKCNGGDGRINFVSKLNGLNLVYFNSEIHVIDDSPKGMIIRKLQASEKSIFQIGYLTIPLSHTNFFTIQAGAYSFWNSKGVLYQKRERVLHAAIDSNSDLYFCTHFDVFKVIDGDFRKQISLNKKLGFSNVNVRRIICLKKSVVMYGTSGSGVIITKNDRTVVRLTKKDGLLSNTINVLYFDEERNRLWCGTNRGINVIDFNELGEVTKVKSIQNITRIDGLPSDFVVDMTGTKDKVWIAFDKEVASIPKNYTSYKTRPPKLNFIAIMQGETNFLRRTTQFNYKQNDLRIQFLAYSLKRPLNGEFYRYRLINEHPEESKWVYTNDREIAFMNLDPGEYCFEVSVRSDNSFWSKPEQLHFTITPFFLDRWWIKLTLLVLILCVIFGFVRVKLKKMKRQNEKELEIKNLQLNNQKLELTSLRGQMNPHFIFNVLNSIQKNILTEQKWQANNLLTRFSKLIRSSLEYSRTDLISIHKEIAFLENYLEIEKQRTPDKFDFKIVSELENDECEALIPSLLIQPICENAIKHAFVNGKGMLEVRLQKMEANCIKITVSDNGIGYFNSSKKEHEFKHSVGLEIVESRLKLLTDQGVESNVKIDWLNKIEARGTKVTLTIPSK